MKLFNVKSNKISVDVPLFEDNRIMWEAKIGDKLNYKHVACVYIASKTRDEATEILQQLLKDPYRCYELKRTVHTVNINLL